MLECLAQDKRKCCFDFTVTTANTRTLTDVKMFVDENGNGKYDEDVDILIKDYGNKLENAKRQSIDGKDLNEEINSLMSSGSFEITVTAVDSDNKKGSAKLVVKTKSKLFNLN